MSDKTIQQRFNQLLFDFESLSAVSHNDSVDTVKARLQTIKNLVAEFESHLPVVLVSAGVKPYPE